MNQKQLLILLASIISIGAFAQPVLTGQKTIGGYFTDKFSSMYLTRDGGLIIGGTSESSASGDKTENNRGWVDYWVVKLNRFGKIQWNKTIGGNDVDDLHSLQQTTDGGYILGGTSLSDSSGEKTENGKGEFDYWVVKLDGLGNIEWDKTIGGNGNDALSSLQQTCDGGYILGGYSDSNISGDKTQNSKGGTSLGDYWVVKLNKRGQIQWDKTIGGNAYEFLNSIQQTNDSGYILGGYSESNISGDKTENGRGEYDYWIVKLNRRGQIQWDKTIGGNDWDMLYSLQQTKEGGYILGGRSSSNISGEKTENNRGLFSEDYWVVKLNTRGQVRWDKTIGGSGADLLNFLQQTSDGGYIFGGSSDSDKSGEKTENSRGDDDYWIVKMNGNGKIQWDKTIGGNHSDDLGSIKEIEKNRYVLGGSSSSDISGDKKNKPKGGTYDRDYWIVWLQYEKPATLVASSSANPQSSLLKDNRKFSAYPNPAKNIVNIKTGSNAIISLTDQMGKIMLTKTIEGSGVINVTALPAGLYYLKNDATGETQKIIVIK